MTNSHRLTALRQAVVLSTEEAIGGNGEEVLH